jgi:hypothetical protein
MRNLKTVDERTPVGTRVAVITDDGTLSVTRTVSDVTAHTRVVRVATERDTRGWVLWSARKCFVLDDTDADWIPFAECSPREHTVIEVASHKQCGGGSCTFVRNNSPDTGRLSLAEATLCGYTHWRLYQKPAKLPPKPLPALPEGWTWGPEELVACARDACCALYNGCVSCEGSVPVAVIDALRAAAG